MEPVKHSRDNNVSQNEVFWLGLSDGVEERCITPTYQARPGPCVTNLNPIESSQD